MRKLLLFVAGGLICVAVIIGAWWGARLLLKQPSSLPQPIAHLSDCVGQKFECYYQYLRPRTINDGPSAALSDIKQAYATDPYVKAQCHELVHIVGAAAFEHYSDLQAVLRYDDPMCESGYRHGAEEALEQHQAHTE